MEIPLIQLNHLSRIYRVGQSEVKALQDLSYTIHKGDFIAVMGPSGSGKSTLMNIIGCLDKPSEGEYYMDGQLVSGLDKNQLAVLRNKKIGFVFQSFNLLSRTTALENTELPLLYANVPRKKAREMSMVALASVGLKGREQHRPNELSGGEMQRVAIARALVNNPSLLLADEPTGNLDTQTGNEVMELFSTLNKQKGITIVLVTHENEIALYAQRCIHLRDGLLVKEESH